MQPSSSSPFRAPAGSARWSALARAAGIGAEERLTIALSGGADSVLLLHLVAAAEPRPSVVAVHVDHGLRGAESAADRDFAEDLARSLGVPFECVPLALERSGPSLEARARRARYAALVAAARRHDHRTLLTGHHADDALETLLQRWMRGSAVAGLAGPARARTVDDGGPAPVRIVRPLWPFTREEVRLALAERGLAWREDGSNADPAFTRNRIRGALLPDLVRAGGPEALANLRRFARAVEAFETRAAVATSHLEWRVDGSDRGSFLERRELERLPRALRRRALWRLLALASGRGPRAAALEGVLDDLETGARTARHSIAAGWALELDPERLSLIPPAFDSPAAALQHAIPLCVPGCVRLEDGRALTAERLAPPDDDGAPSLARGPFEVDLDAEALPRELVVRPARPGERFHGLGAPGARRVVRFLADRGVPASERARTLVVAAPAGGASDTILWVIGHGPCERHRVRPSTRVRLRLALDPR